MKNKFRANSKLVAVLVLLSTATFIGHGCDGGGCGTTPPPTGNLCDEVITVSDTSEARLYYPCDISGLVGATSLTSGWIATYDQVEWLAEEIVDAGYVVLAATPSGQLGMVPQWREAHKACISKLIDLNSTHSVLRGKIDVNKLQTCGHSKGGGGSLWASSELQVKVRSAIGMAPYQEQFQDSDLGNITAATLIQAGDEDTLATGDMTRGEFDALPGNISRAYIRYANTEHVAWTSFGSNQDRLARDIVAWMKYYLDGDTSQANYISDNSGTTMHEWVR